MFIRNTFNDFMIILSFSYGSGNEIRRNESSASGSGGGGGAGGGGGGGDGCRRSGRRGGGCFSVSFWAMRGINSFSIMVCLHNSLAVFVFISCYR